MSSDSCTYIALYICLYCISIKIHDDVSGNEMIMSVVLQHFLVDLQLSPPLLILKYMLTRIEWITRMCCFYLSPVSVIDPAMEFSSLVTLLVNWYYYRCSPCSHLFLELKQTVFYSPTVPCLVFSLVWVPTVVSCGLG